jgi:hypothetical protein
MIILTNRAGAKKLSPAFHEWIQHISFRDRLPRGNSFRGVRTIMVHDEYAEMCPDVCDGLAAAGAKARSLGFTFVPFQNASSQQAEIS